MIVLDTTILAYAVGVEHPLRDPCRGIVQATRDELVRATTTIEVIQELAHIRARRRPRSDAVAVARGYADGLSPLVATETEDLLDGLVLFEQSDALAAFDAVLAALARRRGMALASADRSFADVAGVTHLNPASDTFLDDAHAVG